LNERLINRYIIVGHWEGSAMIKVTDYRKGYWAEAPLQKLDLWRLGVHSLWFLAKKLNTEGEMRAMSEALKGIVNLFDKGDHGLIIHVADPWMILKLKRKEQA